MINFCNLKTNLIRYGEWVDMDFYIDNLLVLNLQNLIVYLIFRCLHLLLRYVYVMIQHSLLRFHDFPNLQFWPNLKKENKKRKKKRTGKKLKYQIFSFLLLPKMLFSHGFYDFSYSLLHVYFVFLLWHLPSYSLC